MSTYPLDLQALSIGLLVVRVVIGLIMAAHGAQKLLGWFGGRTSWDRTILRAARLSARARFCSGRLA